MRKIASKKALSPVVASIILIAVTVAVSIAVAAWMGALTINFMKTEEFKITSMTFTDPLGTENPVNGTTITLAVKNTGTGKVTIANATVNDVAAADISGTPSSLSYESGDTGTIVLTHNWKAGDKYRVALLSSTGTVVATYEKVA